MILLIAVFLGLTAGFARARINGTTYQSVELKSVGLVLLAYLPQLFAFFLPSTRTRIPDNWIPIILIGSQIILLYFAWINRKHPGFRLLCLGLFFNFLVIVLNGGMMPLPPENAAKLVPPGSDLQLEIGQRAGFGKDVILLKNDTNLWFLGDIFMLPEWINYPLAYSLGDILISIGAFWLLFELGNPKNNPTEVIP
jgi:hypothetical protein